MTCLRAITATLSRPAPLDAGRIYELRLPS